MELEGDGERRLQPAFAISAPCQEGISVDAAVLVDNAVEFRASHCRRADYHSLIIQYVLTGLADGFCQMQLIGIKLLQIVIDGNVAETESAFYIIHYHVDSHTVIFV